MAKIQQCAFHQLTHCEFVNNPRDIIVKMLILVQLVSNSPQYLIQYKLIN